MIYHHHSDALVSGAYPGGIKIMSSRDIPPNKKPPLFDGGFLIIEDLY